MLLPVKLCYYKQHCKKGSGGENVTSSPGRFSLALEVGRQGKAPWGRGWGKWSFNWRWLATLSGRVRKIGIFL